MDDRAAIPVTLPRPNPTISYWQDPPAPMSDFKTAEQVPEYADTVIIGSGISGASVAWNLLSNSEKATEEVRVVMLEAREACSGATGRNGGHTKAASYRSFLSNVQTHGLTSAIQIARFEFKNIKAQQAFAKEHGIDCDLFTGDTVDIIYDQAQWLAALKAVTAMREAMPKDLDGAAQYTFYDAEETRDKFHCRGEKVIGAIKYQAGSLSAYKFVIRVLKMCLEKGMELFTNTPALSVTKDGDGRWLVETEQGTVKAGRVVLATNGYTGFLWKGFQNVIVPLRGQVTAHRPGANMPKDGLKTTYSFIYENGYEYMVPRPEGSKFERDIVIGGGLVKAHNEGLEEYGTTDDTRLNPQISEYLKESTARYFGGSWGEDSPDGRVRREWTGIMGYTSDGLPFVGQVPGEKELWISASFQGHGMVLCFLSAKALVQMMVRKDEDSQTWFPASFKPTRGRMQLRFAGKLHLRPTSSSPNSPYNTTNMDIIEVDTYDLTESLEASTGIPIVVLCGGHHNTSRTAIRDRVDTDLLRALFKAGFLKVVVLIPVCAKQIATGPTDLGLDNINVMESCCSRNLRFMENPNLSCGRGTIMDGYKGWGFPNGSPSALQTNRTFKSSNKH
ncbi:hypothetical protein B7494_g4510 [Chlorociboria aeruginascens]|nr:hypothetical protein B7494_g4510 [Chlorociboria aeruginascens]